MFINNLVTYCKTIKKERLSWHSFTTDTFMSYSQVDTMFLFFFLTSCFSFFLWILHSYLLPIFPLVYFSYWFVRVLYMWHTVSVSSINFPVYICHLMLFQLLTDIQNVPLGLFLFLHFNYSNLLKFSFDNFFHFPCAHANFPTLRGN